MWPARSLVSDLATGNLTLVFDCHRTDLDPLHRLWVRLYTTFTDPDLLPVPSSFGIQRISLALKNTLRRGTHVTLYTRKVISR